MAIQTLYKGIEFRSRLEAKWAAFFTNIGWEWTYEPFDGEGYIPDFLIHGQDPFLVEVKPAVTGQDYGAAVPKVLRGLEKVWPDRRVLIVGASPFVGRSSEWDDFTRAGLLIESVQQALEFENHRWGRNGDYGLWTTVCHGGRPGHDARLDHCGVAVWHELMSYHASPCGHSAGGRPPGYHGTTLAGLTRAWAEATNNVKWRAVR